MDRIVVIGNSGGGKSVLARRLAASGRLPYIEIDAILWQQGWRLAPARTYAAEHARIIAGERWLIDGLGRLDSVSARFERASAIILVDLPLWVHFWLAAERQMAWANGRLEHPPAGIAEMPPTAALFRTIWENDRDWLPKLRQLAEREERRGKPVSRLTSLDQLDGFALD